MTTKEQLKEWFELGEKNGATHMIIVVDTFDYEDYPVWVMPDDDVREVMSRYDDVEMQRIMEIYKISLGWEAQSHDRVRNL